MSLPPCYATTFDVDKPLNELALDIEQVTQQVRVIGDSFQALLQVAMLQLQGVRFIVQNLRESFDVCIHYL
jgi:hypothetical protein